MKSLKVYGWTMIVTSTVSSTRQRRCFAAAESKADLARKMGYDHPRRFFCLSETGNDLEIMLASRFPHHYFHRGDSWFEPPVAVAWKEKP